MARGQRCGDTASPVRRLQYSVRSFARTPTVATALVITIAIGVGSNAAVYGFMRGLIAHAMPGATSGVYALFTREHGRDVTPLSYNDFRWIESHVRDFEWLGAAREFQSTSRPITKRFYRLPR